MKTFSQHFNLNKTQYELDFVDVPIDKGDVSLFIDPYAISKRGDYWSVDCHNAIVGFFQGVIDQIREVEGTHFFGHLYEGLLVGIRWPERPFFV